MSMNHLANKAKKLFVDSLKVRVRGGTGGHGLPQYGGIGGKGGDVYIVGTTKMDSLRSVRKVNPALYFEAGHGKPSLRTRLIGVPGKDALIKVPLGVSVEGQDKQQLGDINEANDKILVALGGRGGDKFNDNHGFAGQRRTIKLDLKLISDAVFVGFPNAGKSSLLKAVSRAEPKVANYPFTTLRPNLGVVSFSDYRKIVMADLPGLIEGAHKNQGLGHEFLKHLLRTKLLVFVIDIENVDLGPSYAPRSPLETLCILNKEIELYDDRLLSKPAILAISKMDTVEHSSERLTRLKQDLELLQEDPKSTTVISEDLKPQRLLNFDSIIDVSSKTNHNIEKFKNLVRDVIDKYAELEKAANNEPSSYRELKPLETNRLQQ